jgi:hypothetical protein
MLIRHRKIYGYFITSIAIIDVILGLYSGNYIVTVGSFLLLPLGIAWLIRPYATVDKDTIIIHALFGSTGKVYRYASYKDIDIKNNKAFILIDGQRKRLPIFKMFVETSDWDVFAASINSGS